MIERAAAAVGLELKAHLHVLRHACGYTLANKGHDTRAIQGWLGIDRSPARPSTRRWRRTGSRTSGGIEQRSADASTSAPRWYPTHALASADIGKSKKIWRSQKPLECPLCACGASGFVSGLLGKRARPQPFSVFLAERFIGFVGKPLDDIAVHRCLDLALFFSTLFDDSCGVPQ
jgi:hypothetical protein